MFVVHNLLTVGPDEAAEFEKVFSTSMAETLGGVPGLKRTTLMRPDKPGDAYVSTMEFEDRAAFSAWMKSDSFKQAHSDPEATGMRAPSGLAFYTVIAEA